MMNLASCSSSSELSFTCFEGLRCVKSGLLPSDQFSKVDCGTRKGHVMIAKPSVRRNVISSHIMPGHLEGSFMRKRRLEEPSWKLEFVRTLLIDNYDSYTYNIYQELSVINGVPPVVVRNNDLTWTEIYHLLYEENAFDNVVISPGPGSPTCPADIGICLQLLLECGDIPILGVCLGHQALGYVHGADIVHASEPVHGRLSEIEHNGCGLFRDIPSGTNSGFKVVRYHSLVIDENSLPKELIPIAWTSSTDVLSNHDNQNSDAYQGCVEHTVPIGFYSPTSKTVRSWDFCHTEEISSRVLMGIMHSTRPHYGVQFHPESIATCHGKQIFKNFRDITEKYWLSTRSPFINGRGLYYAAHMQVPSASHQLRDARGVQLVNNADDPLFGVTSGSQQSMCSEDEINRFGISSMMNHPNLQCGVKFLKLKWRKLDHLATQVGGAKNIFCKLFGDYKAENTFWLDSSSTEKKRARFSFMGGKGGSLWKQVTFRLSDQRCGGDLSIEDAQGSTRNTFLENGFFDFLNKELQSFHYEEEDFEGLPFDFYGGYIGYIGYSLKVECGSVSNRHSSRTPDACLFFADNMVVVDHYNDDVYIMSVHEGDITTPWLDDIEQKLLSLKVSSTGKLEKQSAQPAASSKCTAGFLPEKSREEYMKDVNKCLEYIKDGESYELCLTTQIRKRVGEIDSLGLYLRLREKNPAPYAAWLNFSKENLSICSSSPERFLQLDKNGTLEAKPIKGTIPRGATKDEDDRLKFQLQYSEKDQSENLMIVDLLRNDLGRVCVPGSVHVPRLMDVESYATVHTMVSTIRGQKRSDISAVDCVRAAFPGGSMTGAPKLRSMDILDSLESCSRGIYSGSIGFFSYNQTFDLNIVIRTVVIHEGEASIGAGGAIVALSNPEDEYEEMVLKSRAPVKAVMDFQ